MRLQTATVAEVAALVKVRHCVMISEQVGKDEECKVGHAIMIV
jgi:hypothetical protein